MKICPTCEFKFSLYKRLKRLIRPKIIECPQCGTKYRKTNYKSSKISVIVSTIINFLVINSLLTYIHSYIIIGLVSLINFCILYVLFSIVFENYDKYKLI